MFFLIKIPCRTNIFVPTNELVGCACTNPHGTHIAVFAVEGACSKGVSESKLPLYSGVMVVVVRLRVSLFVRHMRQDDNGFIGARFNYGTNNDTYLSGAWCP